MIDEIKGMFTEKLVPTIIVMVLGVAVGVVLSVFTPLGKMFKRKRY